MTGLRIKLNWNLPLLRAAMFCSLMCIPVQLALGQRSNTARTKSKTTADNLMNLGDFYYRSNDTTDAADKYYKQVVVKYPGTQAAGFAQFNRGNYWLRKYYILKEQRSKDDRSALTEAEGQYYDFIDKFAQPTNTIGLLSDAEFYLALVYLQEGKREYAIGWLNKVLADAEKDRLIYIFKVVWTSSSADTVDRNVESQQLASLTKVLIDKGLPFKEIIVGVRKWCQRQ